MKEKIAIRLHSRDRSIMKVLYESAPLNVSWEALTCTQRVKYLKDADLYIKDFSEDIEKVENPYSEASKKIVHSAFHEEGFEDCRQKILQLLSMSPK